MLFSYLAGQWHPKTDSENPELTSIRENIKELIIPGWQLELEPKARPSKINKENENRSPAIPNVSVDSVVNKWYGTHYSRKKEQSVVEKSQTACDTD